MGPQCRIDLMTHHTMSECSYHGGTSRSFKRSSKVKTLASGSVVKVAEDRTIDPALLFQRFLVVSQTGDLQIDEMMNYELSPYPMSLFEAKNILRQLDKPQLAEAKGTMLHPNQTML